MTVVVHYSQAGNRAHYHRVLIAVSMASDVMGENGRKEAMRMFVRSVDASLIKGSFRLRPAFASAGVALDFWAVLPHNFRYVTRSSYDTIGHPEGGLFHVCTPPSP